MFSIHTHAILLVSIYHTEYCRVVPPDNLDNLQMVDCLYRKSIVFDHLDLQSNHRLVLYNNFQGDL